MMIVPKPGESVNSFPCPPSAAPCPIPAASLPKRTRDFYILACRLAKASGCAVACIAEWLRMAGICLRTFRTYISQLNAAGWIRYEYRKNKRGVMLYYLVPLHVMTPEEAGESPSPSVLFDCLELAQEVARKVTEISRRSAPPLYNKTPYSGESRNPVNNNPTPAPTNGTEPVAVSGVVVSFVDNSGEEKQGTVRESKAPDHARAIKTSGHAKQPVLPDHMAKSGTSAWTTVEKPAESGSDHNLVLAGKLEQIGIPHSLAVSLARTYPERVEPTLREFERQRGKVRNVVSWVRSGLMSGYSSPPTPETPHRGTREAQEAEQAHPAMAEPPKREPLPEGSILPREDGVPIPACLAWKYRKEATA
jgi:hypothetical protein